MNLHPTLRFILMATLTGNSVLFFFTESLVTGYFMTVPGAILGLSWIFSDE